MIKKSVDDAVFDAVLAKAFEDAAERDLAEMQTEDVPEYSEAYKKMERRYYNKVKRQSRAHGNRAGVVPVLKRVVSFVLIIGFVSCCVMLSAPTIRAEFVGLVTKFFDECFSITLSSNVTSYETENYIFSYIPNSYVPHKINETVFESTYLFISETPQNYFQIKISKGNNVISHIDVENTQITEVLINSYTGKKIYSNLDNKIRIVWTDSINIYSVYGNISEIELMKIAENIFYKSKN